MSKLPEGVTMPRQYRFSSTKQNYFAEGFEAAMAGKEIDPDFEKDLLRHQGGGVLKAYVAGHEAGKKHKEQVTQTGDQS